MAALELIGRGSSANDGTGDDAREGARKLNLAIQAMMSAGWTTDGPPRRTVDYATAAALDTNTYAAGVITASANGALSVDGASPAAGKKILVKDESSALKNGVYVVTQAGSGALPFILTRADDFSTWEEIVGAGVIVVDAGTANAESLFDCTADQGGTLGTTAITYRLAGPGTISSAIWGYLAALTAAMGALLASTTNVTAHDTLATKGADIASAATTDLSAATGPIVDVTGTGTITALGTATAGVRRTVRCTGACLWTHNATSLILPGSVNFQAAANDTLEFESLGSGNWVCLWIKKQSGLVLTSSLATAAQAVDTTDTTHALTPANLLDMHAERLLFSIVGADINVTTDQPFTKHGTFTSYYIHKMLVANPSVSLSGATGGVWTGAGKTGDQFVNSGPAALANASAANAGAGLGISALGSGLRTETPIFACGTALGSAATADVFIWGSVRA